MEYDVDIPPSDKISTRGYKHRINQLFRPKQVERIDEAVRYVHAIMGNATLLIKYRLIKLVHDSQDRDVAPLILNETQILNAIRAVQHRPHPPQSTASTSTSMKKRKTRKTHDSSSTPHNESPNEVPTENAVVKRRRVTQKHVTAPTISTSGPGPIDTQLNDRQLLLESWILDYGEMTSSCLDIVPLSERGKDLSVSHMLGLAAKQYASSVMSNIRYHFRSYVCCALGIVLRSKACVSEGVRHFDDITSQRKKYWKREFGKAYDDVLEHRYDTQMRTCEDLKGLVNRHRPHLVPSLPERVRRIDTDLDSSTRPYVYLAYMIRISDFIERAGLVSCKRRRLLSPLPLKTSFIPSHYSIDTTTISHLLLDDVKGFKCYFEDGSQRRGKTFPLPGLKDKASICASLDKLAGRKTSPDDEEAYKDALWTFLANFKNRRTKVLNPITCQMTTKEGTLRFAHSISTDGYSVTLICNNERVRGRHHTYQSGASRRKKKETSTGDDEEVSKAFKGEFPLLNVETVDEIVTYFRDIGCIDSKRFVGGDPGKGVLLALMDEFRKKLTYTSKQRKHETDGGNRRTRRRVKTLKDGSKRTLERGFVSSITQRSKASTKRLDVGNVTFPSLSNGSVPRTLSYVTTRALEAEMRRTRATPKTVNLSWLRFYVALRETSRVGFEATYWRKMYRAMRFTGWCKRKGSVERFVDRIREKYGNDENKQVVILYGNWGRRPNLRHQAPTPGIGLRRLIHSSKGITTVTVHEAYTSSYDPVTLREVEEVRGTHALLREEQDITNPFQKRGCFWSRDVLGALNILRKGRHILSSRSPHPIFGG